MRRSIPIIFYFSILKLTLISLMLTIISCQNEDVIPKVKAVEISYLPKTGYMDYEMLDLQSLRVKIRKENGEDLYAGFAEFAEYGLTCSPADKTVLDPTITQLSVTHTESGSIAVVPITVHEKTVTDYEGNEYKVVMIGNQVWMGENLNTIYYPDGTPIPEIIDLNANGSTDDEWASLDDHDDVYYTSEDATFGSYGKLYTWTAAMGRDTLGSNIIYKTVQGVCPDGWHLPSTGEWRTLEEYIGNYGPSSSGIALKSTTGWIDGGNGVDSYGFSAYPTGVIAFPEGNFVGSGEESSWWSSTEGDHDYYHTFIGAYFSKIAYENPNLNIVGGVNGNFKQRGLSVRCIKDELE